MKNLKKFKQRVKAADEKDVEETSVCIALQNLARTLHMLCLLLVVFRPYLLTFQKVFQDSKKTPPEQKKPKTRKRNTRRTGVQKV